jgi:hypothetical protein
MLCGTPLVRADRKMHAQAHVPARFDAGPPSFESVQLRSWRHSRALASLRPTPTRGSCRCYLLASPVEWQGSLDLRAQHLRQCQYPTRRIRQRSSACTWYHQAQGSSSGQVGCLTTAMLIPPHDFRSEIARLQSRRGKVCVRSKVRFLRAPQTSDVWWLDVMDAALC